MTIFISDEQVAGALTYQLALQSAQEAFLALAGGEAINCVRTRLSEGGASLNVMWGAAVKLGLMGVKSYVTPDKQITRGTDLSLLLYSTSTGELKAHIQANVLGQFRTAAASVLATQLLATPNAKILSVFGTGFQAEFQIRSLLAEITSIETVYIVGRNEAKTSEFIQRLKSQHMNANIQAAGAEVATRRADVIVTATSSTDPLFLATWLKPGVHINAIGSNNPRKRELGADVLARATRMYVDDQKVAKAECGDLIMNNWDIKSTYSLADLVAKNTAGRRSTSDITLFESHGLAIQDIFLANKLPMLATGRETTLENAKHEPHIFRPSKDIS
jgi:ornithine cyclodeaminase/alanine dehydrogenase-like protein (mu-crystallin family)